MIQTDKPAQPCNKPNAIALKLYLDGSNDAAFAQLPRFNNRYYLAGYVAKLRELPCDDKGQIQHYSPGQHFAFGYVDSPDPCSCDEGDIC